MKYNLPKKNKYQLRYAAGRYYLLDMEQDGAIYKKPLQMNSIGAEIWKMMEDGVTDEEIVQRLSAECQVDSAIICEDVRCFKEQLEKYAVDMQSGEMK